MNPITKYRISTSTLRWLEVILAERFGHEWRLSRVELCLCLELEAATGAIIFDSIQDCPPHVQPDQACTRWYPEREGWNAALDDALPAPGVALLPTPLIEKRGKDYLVHYDILGLMYWVLARIEEIGSKDLDNHNRFPATSSHAYKYNYLERPIVDEWLHILGQVIQRVWPQLKLKQHQFSIKLSHDVDSPSLYAFKSWPTIVRMMSGHLLRRHDLKAFVTAPFVKLATGDKLHSVDPYNTFDWIMDQSEKYGLTSAFYFICGQTKPVYDADYKPGHPIIRELIRRIHNRGHEIGIHPSYNTYIEPDLIKEEVERLKKICAKEHIEQSQWGGRMHYLRWEHPTTLQAWDAAGMTYDSTLGYADQPGFRCGTCYEYPAFDPVTDRMLDLRIRPLIAMESTVIDDCYMGLGTGEAALSKFKQLKNACRAFNGSFTLLWHNSQLETHAKRELYRHTLTS